MKEIEIIQHLQNMRFAIDHATATKKEFNDMETSLNVLAAYLLPEEKEDKKESDVKA